MNDFVCPDCKFMVDDPAHVLGCPTGRGEISRAKEIWTVYLLERGDIVSPSIYDGVSDIRKTIKVELVK